VKISFYINFNFRFET